MGSSLYFTDLSNLLPWFQISLSRRLDHLTTQLFDDVYYNLKKFICQKKNKGIVDRRLQIADLRNFSIFIQNSGATRGASACAARATSINLKSSI
jgi:hypothetical protein